LIKILLATYLYLETDQVISLNVFILMEDVSAALLSTRGGVMYVRSYQEGVDLRWQEVFQTDAKYDMDKHCQDNNIEYVWLNDGKQFRCKQVIQATANHPVTGDKVWFNQANLFHVFSLGEDGGMLIDKFGPDNMPCNAYFGDGGEISIADNDQINAVI
jgi:hypothetical protein